MSLKEKQCTHAAHVGDRLRPITDFNKRGEKGYQSYCKACQRGYSNKHYTDNKNYYAQKRDVWRSEKTTPKSV
jgi:hypothetical protein